MMRDGHFDLDRAISALLSLLLAFVVWLATSRDARPIDDVQSFPRDGGIEATFENGPEGFVPYAPNEPRISVQIRGIRGGIQSLGPTDLRAVVDLRAIESGAEDTEHVLPVQVECERCGRLGIRAGAPTPSEIAVRLDRVIEEPRRVFLELPDSVSEERVLIERDATPATVTVFGASRQIRRLARVVAVVPLALGADPGQRSYRSLPLRMLDAQGNALDDIAASPERVDARVTIGERGVSLPVVARIVGELPEGYYLFGFEYEPHSVRVLGAGADLAPVLDEGQVATEEIELGGFTTDQTLAVALDMPQTLRAEGLPNGTITVTLNVRALPGSRPIDVSVEAIGIRSDRSATVSPATVRVLVSGPQPVLDALEPGDVRAVVNAAGLSPGRHRLSVEVRTPVTLEALSVTPDAIELVITAAESDEEQGGTSTP